LLDSFPSLRRYLLIADRNYKSKLQTLSASSKFRVAGFVFNFDIVIQYMMGNSYITGLSSYLWKRSPRLELRTLTIQMIKIFKNIPLLSRLWVVEMGLQASTMFGYTNHLPATRHEINKV
jgi:ABC-type amino acid transport system permease subunit